MGSLVLIHYININTTVVKMNRAEHDQYAEEYDYLVREYESHTSDIIFGLLFEYTDPGDKLLDSGIGTGISSFLFHKAGLNIYGLDNSEKMLDICRKRILPVILNCSI